MKHFKRLLGIRLGYILALPLLVICMIKCLWWPSVLPVNYNLMFLINQE